MTALVTTRDEPGHRNGWADFNKIQAKRLDWVVSRSGQPLVVIELDDRTHNPSADAARDKILNGCGWPVLRFDSRAKPSVQQIAHAVRNAASQIA